MKNCEYCNKQHDGSFATGRFCNSKCAHGFSTKNKRKEINKKVSKTISIKGQWNKGNSIKIKKYCEICNSEFVDYIFGNKTCGNKKCISLLISNKVKGKTGGYRKGGGRSKGSYYKNQYFDSPFEIEVAKFLDENNIKWKRNTKRIYFIFENKKTYYIPDFLINDSLYLETKGYWYGNKKEKTLEAVKQNKLNWILLMQKVEWEKNKNILLNKIKLNKV